MYHVIHIHYDPYPWATSSLVNSGVISSVLSFWASGLHLSEVHSYLCCTALHVSLSYVFPFSSSLFNM